MSKIQHFLANIVAPVEAPEARVELYVNGVSLLDLVRDAERPHAAHEGIPALAGNYGWPPLTLRLLQLLDGERTGAGIAQDVLLNCECGWASCWPLSIRVRVFDRFVVWQGMQQAKRQSRWVYASLDPMRFSRANYMDQVAKLREEFARRCSVGEDGHRAKRGQAENLVAPCAL